ncbi:glutaredoxin [Ancylostoma caninum]|uniref:Glutaredoxin n=1 Tax=Ancylostoma caninum TaxID=29170 RepID=A0A368H6S8_ANCCA|nr:glutaredoxin [Ancylostoma caninum]
MEKIIWGYIAPFGWPICLVIIISYILYSQTIKPKLDQVLGEQRIIQQKKFDEDLNLRFAQRITAVRQKQQLEHDFISQEEKRVAEENARRKLKELEERERKKSVLEATLLTHDLNVHKKKAPDSTRSPSELIDAFISSKPIVVFSKTWCQFCRKAKAALATFRLNQRYYEYIELDERTDLPGDEIIDELGRRYGSKSVPKVFIGGEFIGGADDVIQLLHDGKLEELIDGALGIH